MMAGGSLGHCDHKMTELFIFGEVREGVKENMYLELVEDRLGPV